jgi:hypothetical protein
MDGKGKGEASAGFEGVQLAATVPSCFVTTRGRGIVGAARVCESVTHLNRRQ